MTAFNALEKRVLDLSLGRVPDVPEPVIVIGLFTSVPPENHDGTYGQAGEPMRATTGTSGYTRARTAFATQVGGTNDGTTRNTSVVTITGLPPGTYTHFGVFGASA